jgi:hypothetical protein
VEEKRKVENSYLDKKKNIKMDHKRKEIKNIKRENEPEDQKNCKKTDERY